MRAGAVCRPSRGLVLWKTTLSRVQRHVEHAPRGNDGSRRQTRACASRSLVIIGREAGPVSRSVTRDRSFFLRRHRDSFEMKPCLGRWTNTRRNHGPAPRPRVDLSGRRSVAGGWGEVRVGEWPVRVSPPAPEVVHDGPRLIVSSVRRKARARPSIADSRHPRRAPRKLNKG